ncbi:sensor histidine kinase [Kordiimonas aquimaris]|uniref:sensor histidine kinase n=1 Tax=Kordiimonas aquimaris TaxID=707591 RepID=UPI0021D0258B|nr:histidine kinase [Kordiimonas aquimaris]
MKSSKFRNADILVLCLIGFGMPTYYKVKYLLDDLVTVTDLLVLEALAEYVFSFALAGLLVGLNHYFRKFSQVNTAGRALAQLLVLLLISELVSVTFALFFFNVVYPTGVPASFLFDTALVSLFVPFLLAGLADRTFFIDAALHAEKQAKREEELALAARYEALKARLSPHFLFNSLNTLAEIVESEPVLAVQFIENMAATYRYILEKRDLPLVALEEELNAVRALLGLLDVRHPGALDVTINIASKDNSAQIVPLALQTLIENILKHNQYSTNAPLGVRVYLEEDTLVVQNELRPRADVASTGTGLRSLSERVLQIHKRPLLIDHAKGLFLARLPVLRTDGA